jgi:hypothetical protein
MAPSSQEVTMDCYHNEPRLSDVLSDPIIRTIMTADHVDPDTLEASLRKTARKVVQRRSAVEQLA